MHSASKLNKMVINQQRISEQQQKLIERFVNNPDLTTFLNKANKINLVEMETSCLSMDIKDAKLIESACTKYDLTPEEFFLASYLLTLRRYIGSNTLSFCLKTNNFDLLPLITNIESAMKQDLTEFFRFVKDEMAFFSSIVNSQNTAELLKSIPNLTPSSFNHAFAYRHQLPKENRAETNPAAFSLEIQDNSDENGNILNELAPVSICLKWANSLLNSQMAHFFLANYLNCVQILSNAPESQKMAELDILTLEEKSLLKSFQTAPDSTELAHVIHHFKRNCSINPNKTAINEDSGPTSYAQLNEASSKIVSALLAKFNQEELSSKPVVLVMEKNWRCIATVLGVWKAGGFFYPVDSIMQEKLAGISKTEALCILTNLELSKLTQATSLQVLEVRDLLKSNIEIQEKVNPSKAAYVTMTSGSTGPPKKCIISHEGLSQFASSVATQFGLDENTNILQWVPFSFDVFIGDLVKALVATNGSLTMVCSHDRGNVHKIAGLVSRHKVNFIQTTPKFAAFSLEENTDWMKGVQKLALGGESFEWQTLQSIRKRLDKNTIIYNCYGLTEATVESTVFELARDSEQDYRSQCHFVPIGRPLPGISVQVLDPETLLETPIGGAGGILAISGPTVGSIIAPGEVFSKANATFLSGDSATYLPSGVLDYRGRDNEQMIKVTGGMRINCFELESRIMDISASILTRTREIEISRVVVLGLKMDSNLTILSAALQVQMDAFSNLDAKAFVKTLQKELRKSLPYYMVPQIILSLPKFPLTANGKVDRKALEAKAAKKYEKLTAPKENDEPMTDMEGFLIKKLAEISDRHASSLNTKANLRDQGLTSFQLMKFANILVAEGVLSNFEGITDLFNYPTIQLLAAKLESTRILSPEKKVVGLVSNQAPTKSDDEAICIVGMAFRLPGNTIGSIPDFWTSVSEGTCFVRDFPPNRAQDVLTRMTSPFTSDCVRASFFPSIDTFDHEFFNIAPNEAKHMCPEQRLFLEVGTEALVDAGYSLASLDNANIRVYATASDVEYGIIDTSLDGVAVVGRQSAVVPSRLSYTYNLKGGNYVVDTACSAALTTLEQAVRDMRAGQCDAAIVGGANIYLYPATDGLMGTNLIHSPSASCRPFDEEADGTVSGEGVFAYVLKKRSDALKCGDFIYCNIESVCSNGVGRGNGITAPSVDSQVEVIQKTIKSAGITVNEIEYLETHGTGTVLGDQIELCALGTAFALRDAPLAIGATKQLYGHLDMVAGFLSILKASSVLTFNTSLPLAHIHSPSKYLDKAMFQTEGTRLVDPHRSETDEKLYAGVSAYGLSGTNCHAVISLDRKSDSNLENVDGPCSFLLSLDENLRLTLEEQCAAYSRYANFYKDKNVGLNDICGTQIRNLVNSIRKDRAKEVHRFGLIQATNLEEFIRKLDALAQGVSVLPNNQILTLGKQDLTKYLPKSYKRAPALPKFVFKNFTHWLNPVEPKQQIPETNQMVALTSLLQNKSGEIHALLETAHKLEQLISQFSFGLMSEILKPGSFEIQPTNQRPIFDSSKNFKASKSLSDDDSAISSCPLSPSLSNENLSPREISYEMTFQRIAKIWEDCLGLDKIEGTDIFRDLGGDSLLTVQMAKTVSATFDVKIKASDAFANPSLSLFATLVFQKSVCAQQGLKDFSEIEIRTETPKFVGMPGRMILFPGQGSQKVGMCQSLANCPYAAPLFERAREITGIDILAQSNNPQALESTEFVQVALFVGSLAKIAQLRAESPALFEGIRAVSGLSVGEFAALVFADAIDFEDALKIVHFRGKAMQAEIESNNKTGMVSVFGPQPENPEFKTYLKDNFPDMRVSTYLGDNQFTLGGPLASCQQLTAQLAKEDLADRLGVLDARLLRVAGAFHTDYMKSAGAKTGALIDSLHIRWPKYGVVMNVDGAVASNKESIRFNLKKQTACPVLWRDAMKSAHALGVRHFQEISPSSVLTPILTKRIQGMHNCHAELSRF